VYRALWSWLAHELCWGESAAVPSHSSDFSLCLLTLREMASSGIYKLDDGKPHLSNCFPAKSLLRIPEEGQMTLKSIPFPHIQLLFYMFLTSMYSSLGPSLLVPPVSPNLSPPTSPHSNLSGTCTLHIQHSVSCCPVDSHC
jgi:hypothetical protein